MGAGGLGHYVGKKFVSHASCICGKNIIFVFILLFHSKMGRYWKKKTVRVRKTDAQVTAALLEIERGISIREVASSMGFSKSALQRYWIKRKQFNTIDEFQTHRNFVPNQVFDHEQEMMLESYLIKSSEMFYGLTNEQARKVAYQYALAVKSDNIPKTWYQEQMAGREWLVGFMSRHNSLTLRKPESTSLGRAACFNQANLDQFYDNLRKVYQQFGFLQQDVWNVDETGVTTVHVQPKVIAQRGAKQVGQIASAERGRLVTVCCFINALGNTVPPAFIYPLKTFKEEKFVGYPPGSLGLAHPSGWMTHDNFLNVMKHFIKHVKCSKDKPVLLLLDNHETHLNINVIQEAKNNGVVLLSFPPHCSHRLQPLDVSVYGPFKASYNRACQDFMVRPENVGKPINIYHIPQLVTIAYNKAFTRQNVVSGFEKTGIWPFNSQVFTDVDVRPATVTDRPLEKGSDPALKAPVGATQEPTSSSENPIPPSVAGSSLPSTSTPSKSNTRDPQRVEHCSPEDVCPYPKAAPRQESKKGRKPGKTQILTSTPVKNEIELAAVEKRNKEENKTSKKDKLKIAEKTRSVKRKLPQLEESSEEEILSLHDSDSSSGWTELEDFDEEEPIVEGCHVVVKIHGERNDSARNYVCKILELKKSGYNVKFLKKNGLTSRFINTDEVAFVPENDIVGRLPKPRVDFRSRFKDMLYFDEDLTSYSLFA